MFTSVRAEGEKSSSRPLRPENFWKIDFRVYAWVAGIVAGVTGVERGAGPVRRLFTRWR